MARRQYWTGIGTTLAAVLIFIVPFLFTAITAVKDKSRDCG